MALLAVGHPELIVHRNLLCHYSGYFKNNLTSESSQHSGRDLEFHLRPEDAGMIGRAVLWLYTGEIFYNEGEGDIPAGHMNRLCILVDFWIYGETHRMPRLQNDVMKTLRRDLWTCTVEKVRYDIDAPFVRAAFDRGPARSNLRRMIARYIAIHEVTRIINYDYPLTNVKWKKDAIAAVLQEGSLLLRDPASTTKGAMSLMGDVSPVNYYQVTSVLQEDEEGLVIGDAEGGPSGSSAAP